MSGRRSDLACWWINELWSRSAWSADAAFRKALGRPVETQTGILLDILKKNASTSYGRGLGFESIRAVAEFRARIPITTYDDYSGFVDRIRKGESNVLTSDAVLRLVPSSGSVAARKLIPYTRSLHSEFQSAIRPWVADMFREDTDLRGGPAYWSVSPAIPEYDLDCTVPVGFEDDAYYLSAAMRPLVRRVQAVPAGVRHIAEIETFRITTLLFLLRSRRLRLISVWNPTFLTLLCRAMVQHWERLLRLIADGFSLPALSHAENAVLSCRDRIRAVELERLDPGKPESIWPRLRQISCWTDGQAEGASRELMKSFPNVRLAPKGLIATEAFVSLPYQGARPLAVCSHFFEFIDDAGVVNGVEDLVPGGEYSVVVTTGGGLYRYRLQDRVRAEGFVQRTPSIVFIGKEDRISDLVGEKLNEAFVAQSLLNILEIAPDFALLAPENTERGHRYTLFLKTTGSTSTTLSENLDRELSANPHYELARRLGQLEPPAICRVNGSAHDILLEHSARPGRVAGGIKPSCLSTDTEWRSRFSTLPGGQRGQG